MTRVLQTLSDKPLRLHFGPFNSGAQRRWRKKPAVTAQTRLEDRTRDLKLDTHFTNHRKLALILSLHRLMSTRRRGPFVSVQIMSRWSRHVGLNVPVGAYLRKHPHVFQVFTHPIHRNVCCKLTPRMAGLIQEETDVIRSTESSAVRRLKKLMMMSVSGTLHIHALRLIKRELGLPEDFRDSILGKYPGEFELVDLETVRLIEGDGDEGLRVAEVEKWREREYKEKWLSEFETKYAFPIDFPTGFKIPAGFRGGLREWQRLPYAQPYDREVGSSREPKRFEKRAVGVLHELLSLTVEKAVALDRLVHFRRDFGIPVNVREVVLKHPGIFYVSTRGGAQMVFLREAYSKGCLVSSDPVYVVRRKMLELMLLGCRNTRGLVSSREVKGENASNRNHGDCGGGGGGGTSTEGAFVISILENNPA